MRSRVKYKLTNILLPMIKIPVPKQYHYWFTLFLDPRYVMEIKDIKTFHHSEDVDTKIIIQQIMPNLYEYIMDA